MEKSSAMDTEMGNSGIAVANVLLFFHDLVHKNSLYRSKTSCCLHKWLFEEQIRRPSVHNYIFLVKHGLVGVHGFLLHRHLHKKWQHDFLHLVSPHVILGSMDMTENGLVDRWCSSFIEM
jgi:hypothetical protein